MTLSGSKIQLRPMTAAELPLFYEWATKSDATPFWYGKLYGDKVPTYEEFQQDWTANYFNDDDPDAGRSFVILLNDELIGQINYNQIDRRDDSVELDIIIASDQHKGHGYGTDALRTLINYLFTAMNVKYCWLEPIAANVRAIRAYEKAGFQIVREFILKDRLHYRMELTPTSYSILHTP